jgi:hypothetical protein
LKVDQASLEDVVAFLCDRTGANIYVDWAWLKDVGVTRQAKVTYKGGDKRLGDVLDEVLGDLAESTEPIQYRHLGGVIVVSTAKALDSIAKEWRADADAIAADPGAQKVLGQVLPEFHFNANSLDDVIDFLKDVTGANLYVEWTPLAAAGVKRDAKISVRARGLPLGHVLRLILDEAAAGKEGVAFRRVGHVVVISTNERIKVLADQIAADAKKQGSDKAQEALARVLPEVRFNANKFGDSIDFLRDVAGASLYVDWNAIESAGVKRDTPITLLVRNVPLREVLRLLIDTASGDQTTLDLRLDAHEDVITIATAARKG